MKLYKIFLAYRSKTRLINLFSVFFCNLSCKRNLLTSCFHETNFITNSSYLIFDLKQRSNFRQPLVHRLFISIKTCLRLNLPGHSGQTLQMAMHSRTQCRYHPSTFPERSSRVCSSHKNPPSHYLSISATGGRGAVQWKWNDISELVNSRSIMTVLLGFHFRIIYILADQ